MHTTHASPTKPNLGEFIATHQAAFRQAMASALRQRADVDDALQQAYLRLITEYDRWSEDQSPEERLAYAYRAIQLAAKDVLREQLGRSDRAPKPREIPVDFSYDSREDADESGPRATQLLAQQLLSETAARHPGDDEHLDNALYVAALAALDPVQREIVTRTSDALGANHREVAEQLGLSHQFVRAQSSEARKLIFSLIACARGRDMREATDLNLFGYLEGQKLSRPERRLVQRHLKHCDNCQQLAALHKDVDRIAQRLELPLPLLLGGAGASLHLLGVKAGALASSTAKGGPLASTTASAGGSGGAGFGGLASVGGAKLAVGLGMLALTGAGATAAVTHRPHSHRHAQPPVAAAAAVTTATASLPLRTPKVLPAPVKPSVHHKRHRKRHHRTTSTATTTTTTTVVAAPPPTNPAPSPKKASSRSGGEFVLGGGN